MNPDLLASDPGINGKFNNFIKATEFGDGWRHRIDFRENPDSRQLFRGVLGNVKGLEGGFRSICGNVPTVRGRVWVDGERTVSWVQCQLGEG